MRRSGLVALAGAALLAACGGDPGQGNTGDAYDNQAALADAMAEDAGNMQESLEDQADALREAGDRREDAAGSPPALANAH